MAKYPIILGLVTYDAGKPVDGIPVQQSSSTINPISFLILYNRVFGLTHFFEVCLC